MKGKTLQLSLSDKLHRSSASIAGVKAEERISRYFYHLAVASVSFLPWEACGLNLHHSQPQVIYICASGSS